MNAVSLGWLLIVVNKIIYLTNANWITGNLCWSMPCMNGGSCFGSAYTYLCICPINYSGALCEKRLGVCQENPCGNRGLCIEKSLTTFECRCYFEYMGPTCDEHVPKNDRNIWSSLLPAHTRLLFDMIQDAYRIKAKGKSSISSDNGQIDFIGLLSENTPTSTISMPITSTTLETTFIIHQSDTTETEHIIQAENIQLEKIFPDISTASTLDMNTEQFFQFDNPTTFLSYPETDITSTTMIIETMTTTPAIEQIQFVSLNTTEEQELINITEQSNIIITSTPVQWLNDNNTIDDITTQNLIEETNNNAEFVFMTTTESIDFTSSDIDTTINNDDDKSYPIDQKITSIINTSEQPLSTDTTTISQTIHNQLLYKLCQQIISRIFPNISSSAAAAAALSLASDSSSINNQTVDALLSWLNKHLSATTSTTVTSTIPSLLINEIRTLPTIPLKRVDMDDVLHQMNNNIDNEH